MPGPVGPRGPAGSLNRYTNFLSPATLVQAGSSAVWTLTSAGFSGSEMVFRNGALLSPSVDYSTSGNSITFVDPPLSSDNLVVMQ